MPDEPEVTGPAGADAAHRVPPPGPDLGHGDLVLLADQDRTRWDAGADRRGAGARAPLPAPRTARALPAAGGDQRGAQRRGHGRGTDWRQVRRALRPAAGAGADARSSRSTARSRWPRWPGRRRPGPRRRARPAAPPPASGRPRRPAAPAGPHGPRRSPPTTRRSPWPATSRERAFLRRRRDELSSSLPVVGGMSTPQPLDHTFTAPIEKDGAFATYLVVPDSAELLGTAARRSRSPAPPTGTSSPPR